MDAKWWPLECAHDLLEVVLNTCDDDITSRHRSYDDRCVNDVAYAGARTRHADGTGARLIEIFDTAAAQ